MYAAETDDILVLEDLHALATELGTDTDHNEKLFLAMLFTGFYGQLRLEDILGENDNSMRDSVDTTSAQYSFSLPLPARMNRPYSRTLHVTIWQRSPKTINPLFHFKRYLRSRDALWDHQSELWMMVDGEVPTIQWFAENWTHHLEKPCTSEALQGWRVSILTSHETI